MRFASWRCFEAWKKCKRKAGGGDGGSGWNGKSIHPDGSPTLHQSCVNSEICWALIDADISALKHHLWFSTRNCHWSVGSLNFKFICITPWKHSARHVAQLKGFENLRKHLQLNVFSSPEGCAPKITSLLPQKSYLPRVRWSGSTFRIALQTARDSSQCQTIKDDRLETWVSAGLLSTGTSRKMFHLYSPVIVHTPKAGENMSEAGVAVELGLTLGPFDGAL